MAQSLAGVTAGFSGTPAGLRAPAFADLDSLLQQLFFLLLQQNLAVFVVTRDATGMAAVEEVRAGQAAVHLHRADRPLDHLLLACACLVDDFLAGFAVAVVTLVVTVVAAGKGFAADKVANWIEGSAFRWSRNLFVTTGTSQPLIHHDRAIATLARMAFLRTRMQAAVEHFATILHAGVLEAVGNRDATHQIAGVHAARLLLLANTFAEHIVHLPVARNLERLAMASASLLHLEPTLAFS